MLAGPGSSCVPAISTIHIPGVENWQADYLSQQVLDHGEWSLHCDVFHRICVRWGTPEVVLLASRLNRKVPRFVVRSQDPLADTTEALVARWGQYRLIYAFPPLKLLPRLLRRIDTEGIPVILMTSLVLIC